VKHQLINFVAFQACWFACVLGASNGLPWLGLVAVAIALFLHLKMSGNARREGRLILVAVAMGLVFDSLLLSSGWLNYPNGMLLPGMAPYWILAMWALFATTLNVSMSWIKTSLVLAAVMGAVFGPLSYMAGQRLGGLQFIDQASGLMALAVIWAIAMPLLVVAARRLDGRRRLPAALPLQGLYRGRFR
jgi:hypothetical protein